MRMIQEIQEIPEKLELCYKKNKGLQLPEGVPYIGMGSSYFAPLGLKYAGGNILPEMASEYYHYIGIHRKYKQAVLISQSGRSSETLWCTSLFEEIITIVNDPDSPLSQSENTVQTVCIEAGEEEYSSTKSYLNTLLALYLGHNIDVLPAIEHIGKHFDEYHDRGKALASELFDTMQKGNRGIYVIGGGPNIVTAYEAALTMSETTKIPVCGLPTAQYDHGPKETAANSIVIGIITSGPNQERTRKLLEKVSNVGAYTFAVEEFDLSEVLSPMSTILTMNILTHYFAENMGITETFAIGSKVTEVE